MEGIQPSATYTFTIKQDMPAKVIFSLTSTLYSLLTQPWHSFALGATVGFWRGCMSASVFNHSSFTHVVLRKFETRDADKTYNYAKGALAVSALFNGFQYAITSVVPEQLDEACGVVNGFIVGKIAGEEFCLLFMQSRQHSHQQ